MAKQDKRGLVAVDRPLPIVPGNSWLHQSQQWPTLEVLLSTAWDQESQLASAIVARQSPRSGKVGAATILVDLACLGIKNSIVRLFPTPRDYANGLRRDLHSRQDFSPADLDLVAKIVLTGEAYARRLGLSQPADAAQAKLLLAGADPGACAIPVPTGGPEGKPYFIAGPYDDAPRIIAQLTRAVGEDGFDYFVPLAGER